MMMAGVGASYGVARDSTPVSTKAVRDSALTILAAVTRARGGRRFRRALMQVDLHRPAERDPVGIPF